MLGFSRISAFVAFFVLAALLVAPQTAAADASAPALRLPVDCQPGKTCWIVNRMDVDPGPAVKDYTCAAQSYQGHKGTDFAIRDLAEMAAGVAVIAAADGVVVGRRDGMRDINVHTIGGPKALKGKDCGNGVMVKHPGNWTTQYCHLRRGTITVKKGDRVRTGDTLGLVGLSGATEYPHAHLTVRKGKTIIDPFLGANPPKLCGQPGAALWHADAARQMPYRNVQIYTAGFAGDKPTAKGARLGRVRKTFIPATSPALILWADFFWLQKGDVVQFTISTPDGRRMLKHRISIKRKYARYFQFAGKPNKKGRWPTGTYRGVIRVERAGKTGPEFSKTININVR